MVADTAVNKIALHSATLAVGVSLGIIFAVAGGVIEDASFLEYFSQPSDTLLQLFAGCQSSGAAIGAFVGGRGADSLGRKGVLRVSACVALLSCAPMATPMFCTTPFLLLFAGRIVQGFHLGVVFAVWPVYVNEIIQAEERGFAAGLFATTISLGVMAVGIFEYLVLGVIPFGWSLSLASLLPFVLTFLVALKFLPESPTWLRKTAAIQRASPEARTAASARELCEMKPLLGMAVGLLMGCHGIDVFINYAPRIFAEAMGGDTTPSSELFYSIWIGAVLTVGALLGSLIIDMFNRKTLLCLGSFGMGFCFLGCCLGTIWGGDLIFWMVLLHATLFTVTWGSVAFIVPAELAHFAVRARVVSIGAVLSFVGIGLTVSTWLSLVSVLGQAWALALYAGVSFASGAFVFLYVPETRRTNGSSMIGSSHCTSETSLDLCKLPTAVS